MPCDSPLTTIETGSGPEANEISNKVNNDNTVILKIVI
jgi:hypothetical protein